MSRSQILSFRRQLYLSGTVSSAPRRTRTLEKFRFLGLHRDCDAHSEVGAHNKRASLRKLGRSGGMLPRENFEIRSLKSLEIQVEVLQMQFFVVNVLSYGIRRFVKVHVTF